MLYFTLGICLMVVLQLTALGVSYYWLIYNKKEQRDKAPMPEVPMHPVRDKGPIQVLTPEQELNAA